MTKMIDKQKFTDYYKAFDKEVVLEIIDMFIEEYPERFSKLKNNIQEKDYLKLQFNAHSLKGVIANFTYSEPHQLAKELEDISKDINNSATNEAGEETNEKVSDLYTKLNEATKQLIADLRELRKDFQ